MAFPLTKEEAQVIMNKRFGLRVGRTVSDFKGAAYALDDGAKTIIPEPYMSWDYHLTNTMWKIQGFEGAENKLLLFVSRIYGTAERYKVPSSIGIFDLKTFPKLNRTTSDTTVHASTPIGTKAIATLMQWVFDCINTYG